MTTNVAETNLTDEQRTALDAHDRSVSLAAGAGCGKTLVLTERFLSYLDPRVLEPAAELAELVAITFTDAAAREMRDRIRNRCFARYQSATDEAERQAWQRLLRSLDGAKISTIHSYCAALLRSHAVEAEVDPRFELLDAPAAQLLRLQTMDDRLRELLLEGNEQVVQLATRFRLRNLRDHVARLLGDTNPNFQEQWVQFTPDQLVDWWREAFATKIRPLAISNLMAEPAVAELREICQPASVSNEKLRDHFDELLQLLESLPQSDDLQQRLAKLQSMARVQGVCDKKDWVNAEDYERYKLSCKKFRDLVTNHLLQKPWVDQQLQESAATGLELLRLVNDVAEHHAAVKRSRNLLEFDDLLQHTYELLTDKRFSHVRANLSQDMQLLMVDEFQDTNPLQVAIVQALRGEQWAEQGLFVVGDSKQSIYRFRGAEPRVSSELRATLPAESRLSLTTNFRSQPAILDFVNAIFHGEFAEADTPLKPSRTQQTETPAVEFLWAVGTDEADDDRSARQKGDAKRGRIREARFIAKRLSQWIDSGERIVVGSPTSKGDLPQPRAVQLGDIAILLRALSDVALYEAALREQGLDYYLAGGHAFYAQQEIWDVLHLLQAIASPADELSLAGALRSPLFALEDETMFWLVESHGSLNAGLMAQSPPTQLGPGERAKLHRAASTLTDLRSRKDQLLVSELLLEAIERTALDATLLGEFLGQRKVANIDKLVEQARAIDRTSPGDLNGFITQLSEFVVSTPKEPLAATSAEGNVIRIMTIHNAKGLEFPVVVVPDLNRKNRSIDIRPEFDRELGPLVPNQGEGCVGFDLYAAREKEQEELKRLLYVACTRAADYLVLSSSINDLDKPTSEWLKLIGNRFDLRSGRCRADLPEGFAVPEVRVTDEEPRPERMPVGNTRGADLCKLIEKTHQLAESGQGMVPDSVVAIPADTNARRRFSFSRLSGELAGKSLVTESADSYEAESRVGSPVLDSRGFGTLIHAVLERIKFGGEYDVAGLCEFLAPLHVEQHAEEASASVCEMVSQFLASERAVEIAEASVVRREVEFVLPWLGTQGHFEGHYLHGFIDCLYQDAQGGWHLLDYKSNQLATAGVPAAAQQYAAQMFVYTLACERALGVEPVESVLHFLRPKAEFSFEWAGTDRSVMAAQLNESIHAELEPASD